jgi:hypothetical protein
MVLACCTLKMGLRAVNIVVFFVARVSMLWACETRCAAVITIRYDIGQVGADHDHQARPRAAQRSHCRDVTWTRRASRHQQNM